MPGEREDPSAHEVRAALDRIVAEGLPSVAGGIGALLLAFVFIDPIAYPGPATLWLSLGDAAAAAAFLAVFALTRRKRGLPVGPNTLAALLALIVVANVAYDILLTGRAELALYLIVVCAGVGSFLLSAPWTLTVLAASLGTIGVLAWRLPGEWVTPMLVLFASCVLSFILHQARIRTHRRLETLRLATQRTTLDLASRERALQRALDAASESEARYRQLVEKAPHAILVHSGGSILYANPAAAALFGASSEQELLGRDVLSLPHPDFREVAQARIRLVEDVGVATDPMEMCIVRLDGKVVDVEAMGQPIHFLGRPADQTIVRDITDRKRAEAQRRLAEARLAEIAKLKDLDRMKTQFVNTLSHELRTPLTPMRVQLHLLKQAAGDLERTRRAADMLERNFNRVSSLVDELLDMARLQAGTFQMSRAPVSLDATVAETVEAFTDVGRQAGIDVAGEVTPGLVVDGDAKRLTQVMYNLLSNAMKFTPRGGRVTVEATAAGGEACVRVVDTGLGLAPSDAERLFEPFTQVHDPTQRTNAGTGLGLYISRGIVEAHGGRIWVESEGPDRGSTFAFTLPLASPAVPAAEPALTETHSRQRG